MCYFVLMKTCCFFQLREDESIQKGLVAVSALWSMTTDIVVQWLHACAGPCLVKGMVLSFAQPMCCIILHSTMCCNLLRSLWAHGRWAASHLLWTKARGGNTATAPWLGHRNQHRQAPLGCQLRPWARAVSCLQLAHCLCLVFRIDRAWVWPGLSFLQMKGVCARLPPCFAVLPC